MKRSSAPACLKQLPLSSRTPCLAQLLLRYRLQWHAQMHTGVLRHSAKLLQIQQHNSSIACADKQAPDHVDQCMSCICLLQVISKGQCPWSCGGMSTCVLMLGGLGPGIGKGA